MPRKTEGYEHLITQRKLWAQIPPCYRFHDDVELPPAPGPFGTFHWSHTPILEFSGRVSGQMSSFLRERKAWNRENRIARYRNWRKVGW